MSKNGIALAVMLISFIGGNVSEADLTTTVTTIGQLVSLGMMFVNQLERKNVDKFFFKRKDDGILE